MKCAGMLWSVHVHPLCPSCIQHELDASKEMRSLQNVTRIKDDNIRLQVKRSSIENPAELFGLFGSPEEEEHSDNHQTEYTLVK